jgi:hypothetical protein
MNDDDPDEWIDAMLKGWDPSKDGWGPFEFDDIEAGPPLTSIDDLKRAHEDLSRMASTSRFPPYRRRIAQALSIVRDFRKNAAEIST